MRKERILSMDVEFYDSIESLPVVRFHRYNKMILVDAGIGSDLSDFDAHIQKARVYLANGKHDLASMELDNLRQNVYMIQSGVSPRHLAFCVLVKSIDGVDQLDITDEGLKAVLERFNDYPVGDMAGLLDSVKKKIDDELVLFFPEMFDDSAVKEYYGDMLKRASLILQMIIDGESPEVIKEINRIGDALIMYNKPSVFEGAKSVEIQHEKNFIDLCLMLSKRNNESPKNYTVLEFYVAFEKMKREIKQENKKISKGK